VVVFARNHAGPVERNGGPGPEIESIIRQQFGDVERLQATDIADAIHYIVSRPRRTGVNEMLIRPTEQQA
jgi:NADP-dependent 3-hydroxy acid dehydrogenase YdfG